jgi:hypothetical protein
MIVRKVWLVIAVVIALLSTVGCARHIKPDKFETFPDLMRPFSGGSPIRIVSPENPEKEYHVPHAGGGLGVDMIVDLNDMYTITSELFLEVLTERPVKLSDSSEKTLAFTIDNMTWETWAGGFSMGAYMNFTVNASNGYTKKFRVQDGSGMDVKRAIGGLASRAVEAIFQDPEIVRFVSQ